MKRILFVCLILFFVTLTLQKQQKSQLRDSDDDDHTPAPAPTLAARQVILISDCAQLKTLLSYPESDAFYELTNDIYCQGIITEPLPAFGAVLEGRGFAIVGLTINLRTSAKPMGLFSSLLSGAVVRNLYFLDCTVQGNIGAPYNAGMLAGEANCAKRRCKVFNVHVGSSSKVTSNTVQTYGAATGGIIGTAIGIEMLNCTVRDTVVVNLDEAVTTGEIYPTADKRQQRNQRGKSAVNRKAHTPFKRKATGAKKGSIKTKKLQQAPPLAHKRNRPAARRTENRNPDRPNPNVNDPTSEENGVYGSVYSAGGGIIGAAYRSNIVGCHNFGYTQNPSSLVVSVSNYFCVGDSGDYQYYGFGYAGGVAGILMNSNISRSGVVRGGVSCSFVQGGVVGLFQGSGYNGFFGQWDPSIEEDGETDDKILPYDIYYYSSSGVVVSSATGKTDFPSKVTYVHARELYTLDEVYLPGNQNGGYYGGYDDKRQAGKKNTKKAPATGDSASKDKKSDITDTDYGEYNLGGIFGEVQCVTCGNYDGNGYCTDQTFSDIMSRTRIYACDEYVGGIFGWVFFSNFTLYNSYFFANPDFAGTGKKREVRESDIYWYNDQADYYISGAIYYPYCSNVALYNFFSNERLINADGRRKENKKDDGSFTLPVPTPGDATLATVSTSTVECLGATTCLTDEETLIIAIEEYFDCNLWIGNQLFFLPQIERIDSERERGAINFDDLIVYVYGDTVCSGSSDDDDDDGKRLSKKQTKQTKQTKQSKSVSKKHSKKNAKGKRDDDVTCVTPVSLSSLVIPNEYHNFNWTGLSVVNVEKYLSEHGSWSADCAAGLWKSLTSLDNVASNLNGGSASVWHSSEGGLFDFHSGAFTAVCASPQQLTIAAWRRGVAVYSTTLILTNTQTIPFIAKWEDIDLLSFSSQLVTPYGAASSAGLKGNTIFAIDDLVLTPDTDANIVLASSCCKRIEGSSEKVNEMEKELKDLKQELKGLKEDNKRMDILEKTLSEMKKRLN